MARQKPENVKELFNLRHASLRNAVEQIFGVDKRRFKILIFAPEYTFRIQIWLVFVLTRLHNFIKNHLYEEINYFEERDAIIHLHIIVDLGVLGNSLTTSIVINQKKDRIANEI